jgi:hypothetical protein
VIAYCYKNNKLKRRNMKKHQELIERLVLKWQKEIRELRELHRKRMWRTLLSVFGKRSKRKME